MEVANAQTYYNKGIIRAAKGFTLQAHVGGRMHCLPKCPTIKQLLAKSLNETSAFKSNRPCTKVINKLKCFI